MKSIVYILIAVFIGSIVLPTFQHTELKAQTVTVQCLDSNPSFEDLHKSADIIKSRLADIGSAEVDVKINKPASSLIININSRTYPQNIEPLMFSKGKIEFYEVIDRLGVLHEFGEDSDLASIMIIPTNENKAVRYSGILGYCKAEDKSDAELCLRKYVARESLRDIKFYWSDHPDQEGNVYLYILNQQASLDNSSIADSKVQSDLPYHRPELMIHFDETGTLKWKDITQRNMNRSIVIVLDNKVLYAPIVKSEISTGRCMLSGDFLAAELHILNSLISNEVLPLEFDLKN